MKILGISCFYHDAAAALVADGVLKAAASEERFTRIKHDPEFPKNAANFCLNKAGIEVGELDYVVFYDKPFTKFDRIFTGYMAQPIKSYKSFLLAAPIWLGRKLWTSQVIEKELGFKKDVLYLTHHLSHAAGAFFGSPFEEAAILTIDGVGEWATASYGVGKNNEIKLFKEMHYPHSLGLLYSAFTYYLGFQVNSAEYKVMGLASYGKPEFQELIVRKLVRVCDDGSIFLNLDYFTFQYAQTMTGKRFEQLLGRPRRESESQIERFHENVAASIQAVTEKIVMKMAAHVREKTQLNRICLSGGVALNATANGKLVKSGLYEDVYAQPAAGDAGGAVGAALYAHYKISGDNKRPQQFFGIGPSFEESEIRDFLISESLPFADKPIDVQLRFLAQKIADGHLVGIFQGAMEFGPRALGFRSIVADPRDNKMKEKINAAVKYREPFRPFAPAVLKKKTKDFFDCNSEAPYMIVNYTVHQDKRSIIPAVTHIDNSSRIQTVSKNDNSVFYQLIEEFGKLTGVPIVLNTSFNLRGYPIVNTPREAVETFCTGGIDFLLLERFILSKTDIAKDIQSKFLLNKKVD